MKEFIECCKKDLCFKIFGAVAIILMIAGFILPPLGVIDNSVLLAAGELFGFAALASVNKAIDKGLDATVTHNNTSIKIENDSDD